IFRVFPIIIASVALMAVFPICIVSQDGLAARPQTILSWLANMFLIDVSLNSTLWALQVELLMAPIILTLYFLERRFGPYFLLTIALIATPLVFVPTWAVWKPLS